MGDFKDALPSDDVVNDISKIFVESFIAGHLKPQRIDAQQVVDRRVDVGDIVGSRLHESPTHRSRCFERPPFFLTISRHPDAD